MRHKSAGLGDNLDKGRVESSGVRDEDSGMSSWLLVEGETRGRGEGRRPGSSSGCRGPKITASLRHGQNFTATNTHFTTTSNPSRWARPKKKQGRIVWISTTSSQSASNYPIPAATAYRNIPQIARIPCAFRVQADPAEQEILFLGICEMLHRSVCSARRMASSREQDNACEQSDCRCAESLQS